MENSVEKNENVEQIVQNDAEVRELTVGEKRLNIQFKKGNNSDEQNLAEHFAHLMNVIDKAYLKTHMLNNHIRQHSKALEDIETSYYWSLGLLIK